MKTIPVSLLLRLTPKEGASFPGIAVHLTSGLTSDTRKRGRVHRHKNIMTSKHLELV